MKDKSNSIEEPDPMSIFNNKITNQKEFQLSAKIAFAALLFFIFGMVKKSILALTITIILGILGVLHLKKSHEKKKN